MNQDLQAKLQKRRQMADGDIEPEISIDDLRGASAANANNASDALHMSADLKAAMERQRRKADGDLVEENDDTSSKVVEQGTQQSTQAIPVALTPDNKQQQQQQEISSGSSRPRSSRSSNKSRSNSGEQRKLLFDDDQSHSESQYSHDDAAAAMALKSKAITTGSTPTRRPASSRRNKSITGSASKRPTVIDEDGKSVTSRTPSLEGNSNDLDRSGHSTGKARRQGRGSSHHVISSSSSRHSSHVQTPRRGSGSPSASSSSSSPSSSDEASDNDQQQQQQQQQQQGSTRRRTSGEEKLSASKSRQQEQQLRDRRRHGSASASNSKRQADIEPITAVQPSSSAALRPRSRRTGLVKRHSSKSLEDSPSTSSAVPEGRRLSSHEMSPTLAIGSRKLADGGAAASATKIKAREPSSIGSKRNAHETTNSETLSSAFGSPEPFSTDFSSFSASNADATAEIEPNTEFFGAFDDATFPAAITETTSSTAADFGTADPFFAASAFKADMFSTPAPKAQERVWDKSPLVDVPTIPDAAITLNAKTVFAMPFVGHPVTNPLNGNIIFFSMQQAGPFMHEVDPHRDFVQTMAAPIISSDLQRRVATKYHVSICGLDSVISISAGLHYIHGQVRVRVAAVLDLRVLESTQALRIVAVWQWGYAAPHPIGLQFAFAPPNGAEFAADPLTLKNADGLLFMAGNSPKGPCVFISKPILRETWSANYLNIPSVISTISVTSTEKRICPYLAIAMSDGSVSVWTYYAALGGTQAKGNETSKRWLLPLCRLEAITMLRQMEPLSFPIDVNDANSKEPADPGYCTDLVWLPPQPSMGSLLLIAATYQNGLAIFHVELPLVASKESKGEFIPFPAPNPETTLAQAPTLTPICATRWKGDHDRSYACWMDLGPHMSPCVGVLLQTTHNCHGPACFVLGTLRLSQYRKGPPPKERLMAFDIFGSKTYASGCDNFPRGLLHTSGCGSLFSYSDKKVVSITPARENIHKDASFAYLGRPIISCPAGLASTGEPLLNDIDADNEGILHIFTVIQCERQKSAVNNDMQEWSRPRKRLWLCKSTVGDTKAAGAIEEEKKDGGFGGDQVVKGGASSDAICELFDDALEGLVPFRIVRCKGRHLCAIMFRPRLFRKDGPSRLSLDACAIAFVEYSGSSPSIHAVEGRDVTFMPAVNPRGVILSTDGSALTMFEWDSNDKACTLGASFRPIVGVDTGTEYVACRRVFAFSGATSVGLLVTGMRLRDNRTCLVSGDLCPSDGISLNDWSQLLPNVVSGRCLWLDEFEEIYNVMGLEGDEDGYRNFGLSTAFRIAIVSSGLEFSAEIMAAAPTCDLAPLGAFTLAFCSGVKIRTLSCLDGNLAAGTLATLPTPQIGYSQLALLAVRPDRLIVGSKHKGIRLVDLNQNANIFLLPAPITRPALLLEAMVANAICVGGKSNTSTAILRTVIEKFGRKVGSITHSDTEGIGNFGAGLTPRTFEMLHKYGLTHAASWLLTGTSQFDRSASSKILPPWLPIAPKAKACLNADAFLHVLASGDPYFAEYIKDPDEKMPSVLPRQSDSTAYVAREDAMKSLRIGDSNAAIKLLDVSGSMLGDNLILQVALALAKELPDETSKLLQTLSGYGQRGISSSGVPVKTHTSIAALALSLQQGHGREMQSDDINRYMKPLAPSLQRGSKSMTRSRQNLLGESNIGGLKKKHVDAPDPIWTQPCNESRHVWNEGPRKEKHHLLSLGSIEDWIGRRRPVILGKEGASAAKDRGEQTLANILNQNDEDSFGGSDIESVQDGWVDGVGEGRTDEANLSAYFRFSEGEDEDSPWPTDGFTDLSPFQNKAMIVGDLQAVAVQPTTSSVDEGDPGKVKSLYDIVFEKSGEGAASGLAIAASRGCSLDVGVLHLAEKSMRQKCTVEFWYFLPSSENIPPEVVLARRSHGPSGDDLSKICLAAYKSSTLWELVLLQSGELEFRTCAGHSLRSSLNYQPAEADADEHDSDDEPERNDLAKFGRWNHVSVVLVSKDAASLSKCAVTLYMKGEEVASSDLSVKPRAFEDDNDLDSPTLNELLSKSYVVFGLDHGAGFRLTELRVWACARSADDTQALMYEYLTAAEAKKKFKVKISSNKNKSGGAKMGKGAFLAPPKGGAGGLGPSRGMLGGPKGSAPRGILAPKSSSGPTKDATTATFSLAPPPKKDDHKFSLAPRAKEVEATLSSPPEVGMLVDPEMEHGKSHDAVNMQIEATDPLNEETGYDEDDKDEVPTTLWDTAIPLSQQIRNSAASALIRGPPATRHFGGNRGGLADHSGMERFGVGGIAICGSEKTIVWRDNEDPPALTYPIGASGAVVSDLMDDEGSEFLCCFLAKEKRMVVFELQSRTVVVELQMTTKLNFWRFLPPEAAENTLCFLLITPVGGFHWMPLEESPRPHQVWKRGAELQGKKVVNYEEGGSNGLDGPDIISRVGLAMVTKASGGGALEAWIIPIEGDSRACQVSDDVMGACFCQPPSVDDGPFLPLLVTAHQLDDGIYVNVLSVVEPTKGSIQLGEIEVTRVIDEAGFEDVDFEPPSMAMGSFPEAILCSLGNIIVVIVRRKGLIAAFELEDDDLSLIALESVGHYVMDAIMRYSGEVGGAEIVMLLSDQDNPKDGRMVSFCFRSTA
ncbi:hypothetical protein MPSEU_000661200 [Mayamaea pseudoterrestris]|nr:hypothetical protein MPSEU_000661200 [Mayamaea pseudoterrestris]